MTLKFDGRTYDHSLDFGRLYSQLQAVRTIMKDGQWHRLSELSQKTGGTEASVSARLRDLRKAKFGGFWIQRRRVTGGLYEYRMVVEK